MLARIGDKGGPDQHFGAGIVFPLLGGVFLLDVFNLLLDLLYSKWRLVTRLLVLPLFG